MIIKYYNLSESILKKGRIFLFYGKNDGLKKSEIKKINNNNIEISKYEEKEILNDQIIFFENISINSLFEQEKILIIKNSTDKLLKIIEQINIEILENTKIIIDADNLDKKSKLRSYFEKDKNYVCVAFYPDTDQTLLKLSLNFLKSKKILMPTKIVNQIITKCNGDREHLMNELNKIELFAKNGKKITENNIGKLINLIENHSISQLVDNYLSGNDKKTIHILNENNFSNDDTIVIVRTFINKAKRLLKLSNDYKKNEDIELTLSSAKPPIFWKDKEVTKEQLFKWKPEKIQKLIYKLNELELLIKKNINLALNLITNFILDKKFII